ncbi:hypothetical protein ACLF6K_07155 [Streptomyces xanthophaeus]|uniref:hypothetical protein n=1 Tax=Streptomyces xanthophaeus TaxID=67385 RepID=UPI00399017C3
MRISDGYQGQPIWHALHPDCNCQALCGRPIEVGKRNAGEAYCQECLVLVEQAMAERASLSAVHARTPEPPIREARASRASSP